ncbi:MATE family efflux transporter [Cellulosilyticum sp. ST5]|uniref:MATE family efflux transporter n=1 Tax=unclassified Cellulosilyticum TaxID=2643091 RepID=UPI000F8E45B1|nr:MATE family efflux transporter [Cellulosilyticum sp. WCF-2]QEH68125.1 MATE family efflux transporter [Cellulosilyticum sp. WCF-2]
METASNDLGRGSIGKLLFKLAVPAILAQIINALYNIVDRIYIGRIPETGDLALTGIGLTFPILMLITAFSSLIGMGGAPCAAIKMGEGKKAEAEKILGNSLSALLVISAILMVFFYSFKGPLLMMFGASSNTFGYANDYLSIYLLGTISVQLALGMNPFINTQGFAGMGMATVLIGAISNIILDPIFIFGFGMGVKGAAIATIISQTISAVWVMWFLLGKKTKLKIRKSNMKISKKILLPIVALGVAPFIMQATESLVNIVLNKSLFIYGSKVGGEAYGDTAVGAMTIISSVLQVMLMPISGLAQGAQPIISYNYGANNMDRVKKTFKVLFISSVTMALTLWAMVMIFPGFFVSLFNDKPELTEMTIWGMRIFLSMIWVMGAQMACQQTFIALGQAKISLFLALLRKVILLVPLVLILPLGLGFNGIFYAEPIADTLAATTTVICFVLSYKKIIQKKLNATS